MFTIMAEEVSSNYLIWNNLITASSTILAVVLTMFFQAKILRKSSIMSAEIDMKKNNHINIEKAYVQIIAASKDFDHKVYQFFDVSRDLGDKTSQSINVNGFPHASINSFFATQISNPYIKFQSVLKENYIYFDKVSEHVDLVTQHINALHNLAVALAKKNYKINKEDFSNLDKVTKLFIESFKNLLNATRIELKNFKIQ